MNSNEFAYEHVWRYFQLHAQQRMTVFNFYLAITGLVATGIGLCLQQGGKFSYISSVLSLFLLFISFIFWKLDQRVSLLLKKSELALSELESNIQISSAHLFSIDASDHTLSKSFSSVWTYGKCLRISFSIVGIGGFILTFLPLLTSFASK
jgi:hypothetical protein